VRPAALLLRQGALDEARFLVLNRHLEDLQRQTRAGLLDDRFDYMPHGMMRRLQQMLADGRVTRWERDHFDEALAKDTLLTPGQKQQVRDLLTAWLANDEKA
jgi:hypothetical protein